MAAKHMFAILCQIYDSCDGNLMFCFQKTEFRDKLLKSAHSGIMSFDTKDPYRAVVRTLRKPL